MPLLDSPMWMLVGGGVCWTSRTQRISAASFLGLQLLWHLRGLVLMASAISLNLQLSAMDVSVQSTMKGAAKCDKHCELQNSVNRQGLERILCFWVSPESTPASVSMLCYSGSVCCPLTAHCCDKLCLKMQTFFRILEACEIQSSAANCQPVKYPVHLCCRSFVGSFHIHQAWRLHTKQLKT